MKVLWSWLCDYVQWDSPPSAKEGAAALTRLGLEVETEEFFGKGLEHVVVAEVVESKPHPESEKLTLVTITDGATQQTVVCGAPNVPSPGHQVLWAKPGTILPGGIEISERKVRGIPSPGMLCSEDEIGIGPGSDGIFVGKGVAENGAGLVNDLDGSDVLFDLSVPANRSDCLGHIGVARELAAATDGRLVLPPVDFTAGDKKYEGDVTVSESEMCYRYVARQIDNVAVGVSPLWMKMRLHRLGVRPISNLVDITNYVMLETGQPLHAFDGDKISDITVRFAHSDEKMVTLDDVERSLLTSDLVIDSGGTAVALAGVMGGASSEVNEDTTKVFLESAHFDRVNVRKTSHRLALRSESSARFEKGVDSHGCDYASRRAIHLMEKFAGGTARDGQMDVLGKTVPAAEVSVSLENAAALCGIDFPVKEARASLEKLDFAVSSTGSEENFIVTVPSHRQDILREVDVIEELLRMKGFDSVPATLPALRQRSPGNNRRRLREQLRIAMCQSGFDEAITFGFMDEALLSQLGLATDDPRRQVVTVQNPMSQDQGVMRTMLLPNLLCAAQKNQNHGVRDVAIFEIGAVFSPTENVLPQEREMLTAVCMGNARVHLGTRIAFDFSFLKGAIVKTFGQFGVVEVQASHGASYLHPNQQGVIVLDKKVVGEIGTLHPTIGDAFGIEQAVFVARIDCEALDVTKAVQMTAIPRFPGVHRDVSLLLNRDRHAGAIFELLGAEGGELFVNVELLEDYREAGKVPEDKKALLLRLHYRAADRTLTDDEVDAVHNRLINLLCEKFDATPR